MRAKRIARIRLYLVRGGSILALAFVTFLFTKGTLSMYARFSEASVARAGAESEVKTLTAREAELTRQTQRLSTDRGMEEEFRHRYGVVKAGEGVIEIVSSTTTPASKPESGGVINWIKRLF